MEKIHLKKKTSKTHHFVDVFVPLIPGVVSSIAEILGVVSSIAILHLAGALIHDLGVVHPGC